MKVSEPARTEKYEKYVASGMSEQPAREKANERTLWAIKNNFFDTYEACLNTNRVMRMVMIRIQIVSKMVWISHYPRGVQAHFQFIKRHLDDDLS